MIKFNVDENRRVGIRRDNTENTVCANIVTARDYSVTELKKYICYPEDFKLVNPDVYIDIWANGNGIVYCVDDAETKYILLLPPSVEKDIIKKHMWPLTIVPPVCREAWIVTMADKYCSLMETLRLHRK